MIQLKTQKKDKKKAKGEGESAVGIADLDKPSLDEPGVGGYTSLTGEVGSTIGSSEPAGGDAASRSKTAERKSDSEPVGGHAASRSKNATQVRLNTAFKRGTRDFHVTWCDGTNEGKLDSGEACISMPMGTLKWQEACVADANEQAAGWPTTMSPYHWKLS